jgi:hypothetical protein
LRAGPSRGWIRHFRFFHGHNKRPPKGGWWALNMSNYFLTDYTGPLLKSEQN